MAIARPPQQHKRPAATASGTAPRSPQATMAVPPRQPAMARPAPRVQAPSPSKAVLSARNSRPAADPVLEGLINTITGLEALVEEETAALGARRTIDLDTFSNRKSQGLMELNRSMKHIDGPRHQKALAPRLDSLRSKLAANQAALQLHLEAVREISGIIASAIREQESDGTYSHTIRKPEAAYGYD